MFFRGVLAPLAIAGDPSLERMAMSAARTVADRFLEIGYMKSFGAPDDTAYPFTTVDDVINLVLPLWLAEREDDGELRSAALRSIDQIAERLVRPDGSTGQVLLMEGGTPSGVDTYQGFHPDGCWSRGQAWGIYGFATVYAQTKEARYLDVAKSMTDYWIDRVQDDPSPVWDFDLPQGEPVVRDSFAAALALAGILELATALPPAEATRLSEYASAMVERLAARYVIGRPRGAGLVAEAALDVPHGHGVGSSVIVGDSYFTEAVWRLTAEPDEAGPACLIPR
jgi:unsaturated chondroitin disaccharide hydrolase